MAVIRTPKTRWIEEALRALADDGPDGVRVEALAQAIGVTKGGFYGQFADRQALLAEMLDTWEHAVVGDVIETVERGGGDAREKLWRLFTLAAARSDVLRVELAIRDWARRDDAVADRLRRVDRRRMQYMRSLFGALVADPTEVEGRCLTAFALFVGTHFVVVDHGDLSRADVMERALRHLVVP